MNNVTWQEVDHMSWWIEYCIRPIKHANVELGTMIINRIVIGSEKYRAIVDIQTSTYVVMP